jgi:hypothetical protein
MALLVYWNFFRLEALKMVNMLFEVDSSCPSQKSKVLSNALPGISKTCMEIALQETGQKVISVRT